MSLTVQKRFSVVWKLLILNMEAFFARANLHFKHGSFFLRANCVWRKRTFHVDDKVHTSLMNMDIALTLAARKFSPAQPFRNRYPRFRIHRSHEYDEEEFVTLFAHPFPTISAHLLFV